jgi:Na+-translocating ferredoxin:NAD+ oxidoreductase RnfE subunit
LILLYTMLPVYMIHQYEEHAHGRFVAFVNSVIGKGHEVLTKVFAFWINILDVWLVFLVSFYLAKYVAIGFALVPIYLTILNAVTHAIAGVVLRKYNPGLYTSLGLFFPWGAFLLVYFNWIIQANLLFNGIGILAGIAGHAVIVIPVLRRRNRLETTM